jgi:hypothetical protein
MAKEFDLKNVTGFILPCECCDGFLVRKTDEQVGESIEIFASQADAYAVGKTLGIEKKPVKVKLEIIK